MLNTIRDVLHNTAPHTGASPDYCHGMIVGVVSALMQERQCLYDTAIRIVAGSLPDNYRPECLPQAFKDDIVYIRRGLK